MARFKIGSTYTLGYGIGKVRIEKPTAKGKTFKAVRLSDGKSIHFGDASMPTRQDNPKAKKNYCSRAAGLAEKGFNPNTLSLIYWDCIPANKGANNMQINQIMINSTVRKSQIVDNGKHWLIKGIPVTVDNAEMNGILYSEEENAKGMPTINQRPITGGHPVRDGYPISVNEDMPEWYIGSNVVKHYNSDGINYVDVKASKSMMRNSDNKLGQYFADKLERKESFGVSTGLNLVPVKNADGKVMATNQQYDHLAFLHDNEAPAGGDKTVVRFNADSGVMVVNVDEVIGNNAADDELEARLFDRIMLKINAFFGDTPKTRYNSEEQTNNHEDDSMSDNTELLQAINALQEKLTTQGEQLNSVVQQNADMKAKMDSMEAEKDAEKKAKADKEAEDKKAYANKLGLEESEAAEMSINTLRKLAGEKAPITANAAGGFDGAEKDEPVFGANYFKEL